MIVTAIGIAILALIGFWMFGGVLLRAGGLTIIVLGGHWHYALRHHAYKSPLVERIFCQVLPRRLDPTRGWGVPVVPVEPRRESQDRGR